MGQDSVGKASDLQENCGHLAMCACRICPLDRERRKGAMWRVHGCSHSLSPTSYTVIFSPRAFHVQDHRYTSTRARTPTHTHTHRLSPRRQPGLVSRAPQLPCGWLHGLSPSPALHVGVTRRQAARLPKEPFARPRARGRARPRGRTDKAGVQSSPVLPPRREGTAALTGPMSEEPEWDFLPESRWPK